MRWFGGSVPFRGVAVFVVVVLVSAGMLVGTAAGMLTIDCRLVDFMTFAVYATVGLGRSSRFPNVFGGYFRWLALTPYRESQPLPCKQTLNLTVMDIVGAALLLLPVAMVGGVMSLPSEELASELGLTAWRPGNMVLVAMGGMLFGYVAGLVFHAIRVAPSWWAIAAAVMLTLGFPIIDNGWSILLCSVAAYGLSIPAVRHALRVMREQVLLTQTDLRQVDRVEAMFQLQHTPWGLVSPMSLPRGSDAHVGVRRGWIVVAAAAWYGVVVGCIADMLPQREHAELVALIGLIAAAVVLGFKRMTHLGGIVAVHRKQGFIRLPSADDAAYLPLMLIFVWITVPILAYLLGPIVQRPMWLWATVWMSVVALLYVLPPSGRRWRMTGRRTVLRPAKQLGAGR